MSGLEKFEGTEAWFARLKSLLLKDRPAPRKEDIENPISNISIDLSEDLKTLLQETRIRKMDKENKQPNSAAYNDSSENRTDDLKRISAFSQDSTQISSFSGCNFTGHNDSTFYEEPSILRQTTDESFERVEKMCNKSLSDPDSTLFQYVKSFQESRKLEDEESEALERLLDEFDLQGDRRKMSIIDQTQIANVEPPSCMWEDTLSGDVTTYRTSPVKMVGLLRPSTILEESLISETTSSSTFSYKSAHKTADTSSERYDTASETNKANYIETDFSKNNTEDDNQTDGRGHLDETLSYEDSYGVETKDYAEQNQFSDETNHEDAVGSTAFDISGESFSKSEAQAYDNPDMSVMPSKSSRISFDLFPHKKHIFFGADHSRGLLSPDEACTLCDINGGSISSNDTRNTHTHNNEKDYLSKDCTFNISREFNGIIEEMERGNTSSYISGESFPKSEEKASKNPNISTLSSKSSSSLSFDIFPHKKHTFFGADLSRGLLSSDKVCSSLTAANISSISSNDVQHKNTLSDVSSLMEDSLNLIESSRNKQQRGENEYRDSLEYSSESRSKIDDLINLEDDSLRTPRRSIVIKAEPTIIELSDDEKDNLSKDLNDGFSLQEEDENNTFNISREFNDTIEEMEYIMQRGMKYMTEKGATPKVVKSVVLSAPEPQNSPSIAIPTCTAESKQDKKLLTVEKPKVVDSFKKPTSCTRIPQAKSFFGIKKATNFSHVVSPVGAYIKNTPKVPLTVNARSAQDVYKTKAMRELEFGSRAYTAEAETRDFKTVSTLPKKAYISSEFKCVVDQRAPVVIPGGEKIHRYLQPAATVIRHEGKFKMNMTPGDKKEVSANQTVNNSLADLSVMSGDVSLLTIKDAKKPRE